MFANAAGEHQRVEPAEQCGQRADFLDGTPYKQLNGLRGPLGVAGQQRPHVTRHTARDAQQSGLVVQQVFDRRRAHAAFAQQVQHDAGVQVAGRVPINSPSRVENPMVVPQLMRLRIAHRLAPLPRCATKVRPAAARGS